jgi:virginiamycin B lyase
VTEFPAPAAGAAPVNVVAGPGDSVWFTEVWANKIGRIDTREPHRITEWSIPTALVLAPGFPATSFPWDLTRARGDAIWFAERNGNKIGRLSPNDDHRPTEFALPTANSWPYGITPGRDDDTWFVEVLSNRIGRITRSGELTEYSIPTVNSAPLDLTMAPDNSIWFVELDAGQIGRLNPRVRRESSSPIGQTKEPASGARRG